MLKSATTAQFARDTGDTCDASRKNWMTDRFTDILQEVNTSPPISDISKTINLLTSK